MSNNLGITPVATGMQENVVVAVNNALGVHDGAIFNALEWTAVVPLGGEDAVVTTGAGKITIYHDGVDVVVESVFIGLSAQSSSGDVSADVNLNGETIFSTQPVINATEDTSHTGTEAVLDGTVTLTKYDKISFDVDEAGADAKGLKVYMTGRRVQP